MKTECIQKDDIVKMLTYRVRYNKGDTFRVTRVEGETVHFIVLRNSVRSYKKMKNVRMIHQDE